jgi:hypothetical protein
MDFMMMAFFVFGWQAATFFGGMGGCLGDDG